MAGTRYGRGSTPSLEVHGGLALRNGGWAKRQVLCQIPAPRPRSGEVTKRFASLNGTAHRLNSEMTDMSIGWSGRHAPSLAAARGGLNVFPDSYELAALSVASKYWASQTLGRGRGVRACRTVVRNTCSQRSQLGSGRRGLVHAGWVLCAVLGVALHLAGCQRAPRAGVWARQAQVMLDKGDYHDALKFLDRAQQLDPVRHDIYEIRADVLYAMGAPTTNILRELDVALRISPDCVRCLFFRGVILLSAGSTERAAADASRAIGLYASNAGPYVVRAGAYCAMSNYVSAISDATRALHLKPDEAKALAIRALAYFRQGETAKAEDDLKAALALAPADRVVLAIQRQIKPGGAPGSGRGAGGGAGGSDLTY